MTRWLTVAWQTLTLLAAGVLYFFFTLPRWPELDGDVSPTAGTVLRIVTAVLLASAAAPVYLDLRRTRRPELGTPEMSLSLHAWSIAGALTSGALVLITALTEIWVDLDQAGAWLFAVYAAAAAVAVLGAVAFYLSFLAETPPPLEPVKPVELTAPEADETPEPDDADTAATDNDGDDVDTTGEDVADASDETVEDPAH